MINKINISDIENIWNKIEKKEFSWVSKKFSILVYLWIFLILFILIISFFQFDLTWFSANLMNTTLQNWFHWTWETLKNSVKTNYLNIFYLYLLVLFFAIYTLYIFAKMELQKFWRQNWEQKDFATNNFPSIYILETTTMLYTISFVILSFYLIQQIDFETAFKTMNSSLQIVANFALFWGSLSSLFYFLHKVRPGKFENWIENSKERKIDFDINRVLKYLSFPFMSAWMWVISYLIIIWSWEILWIEGLKNPWNNFLILFAVIAWYFCDAFVIFFHSIFKSIEKVLNKKISK